MKHLIALTAITLLFISSCKKDVVELDTPNPYIPPIYIPSYFIPLTVGNYWVYQDYHIDSLGQSTITQNRDSLYVSHDTIINGNKYSVLKGRFIPHGLPIRPDSTVMILRDSSGYTVDHLGKILSSSKIISDTIDKGFVSTQIGLSDTLYAWYQIIDSNTHLINIPAGSFNTIDLQSDYTYFPNTAPFNKPYHIRKTNHRYIADRIGIVLETFSYLGMIPKNDYIEKRLIKYHIEN